MSTPKGGCSGSCRIFSPKGEARAEWEFLYELARDLCGLEEIRGMEGLFNRMAAEVPGFHGLTWARLGDLGMNLDIEYNAK